MSTTTPAALADQKPAAGAPGSRAAPPARPSSSPREIAVRLLVSGGMLAGYLAAHGPLLELLTRPFRAILGSEMPPGLPAVAAVTVLGALLVAVWWKIVKADPRFHAPILITYILAVADANYGILDNLHSELLLRLTGGQLTGYSPTFMAILASVVAELVLGRFVYGKWPHLASAYISGISVGILVKSPELWPYVMCALISIVSKYALRIGGRHLWNPSNFGVTVLLALGGNYMSSLSVQSGNDWWPVLLIWALGGLILYRLGRWHIPLAFLAAFVPLSYLRHQLSGMPLMTELAPMTWPMFQLYIFFMITDPKTTTKARWSQCAVVVVVAVVETILQLRFEDPHSLYHALFIVAPITNLMEYFWDWWKAAAKKRGILAVAAVGTAANGIA